MGDFGLLNSLASLYDDDADVVLAEAHTGPLAWTGMTAHFRTGSTTHCGTSWQRGETGAPSTRCARWPLRSRRTLASADWRPTSCG